MLKFRIKPENGRTIKGACRSAKNVIHWVVQAFNYSANAWVFLQAFYTEERAKNYIATLKKLIAEGDYSCLTLKT